MVEDSFESVAREVVNDSFDSVEMVVPDSMEGDDENEVQSKNVDDTLYHGNQDVVDAKGFSTSNLNKFPEDDYENDTFKENEKKNCSRLMQDLSW